MGCAGAPGRLHCTWYRSRCPRPGSRAPPRRPGIGSHRRCGGRCSCHLVQRGWLVHRLVRCDRHHFLRSLGVDRPVVPPGFVVAFSAASGSECDDRTVGHRVWCGDRGCCGHLAPHAGAPHALQRWCTDGRGRRCDRLDRHGAGGSRGWSDRERHRPGNSGLLRIARGDRNIGAGFESTPRGLVAVPARCRDLAGAAGST